jgi:hypothetical protein
MGHFFLKNTWFFPATQQSCLPSSRSDLLVDLQELDIAIVLNCHDAPTLFLTELWNAQELVENNNNIQSLLYFIISLCSRLTNHNNANGKGNGFPLQAWNGSWGSRRLKLLNLLDFRHYEGGKVVTLNAPAAFTPRNIPALIFRSWVDPRAHGSVGTLGKKSPATPLGIDPETFRLVAQWMQMVVVYNFYKQRYLKTVPANFA